VLALLSPYLPFISLSLLVLVFCVRGLSQISVSVVPKHLAEHHHAAGHGQSKPNQNPYLPPPVGRLKWSFNPCTLIINLFGPVYGSVLLCLSVLGIVFTVYWYFSIIIAPFASIKTLHGRRMLGSEPKFAL
jgi:hypothetical protein